MNKPFGYLLSAYASGIIAAYFAPVSTGIIFLITAAIITTALIWLQARSILLLFGLFSLGMANLSWRLDVLSPCDLRTIIGEETVLATVRGELQEAPSIRITERRNESVNRTLAIICVNAVRMKSEWKPATGNLMTFTPGVLSSSYFRGQCIEITGILKRPKGPAACGLFDYRSYLKWLGVHYVLETEGEGDWNIIPISGISPSRDYASSFIDWAQKVLGRGLPEEDESLRLLWAMTLGWKTALTGEVSEPFMQTGTMHVFAISGMHTALIALIMVQVLKAIRIPRSLCGWLVLPCLWFYTAATGWQSTAIRSAIMTTVIVAGWMLKRPGNLLNSLYASGFIILVWEPRQLFQASFQLSFFVVLSLALVGPVLESIRQQIFAPDPLLPAVLRKPKPVWLTGVAWYLSSSVISSIAAWLGSVPIIAYYFHLVTPVSLLANLVIVPLSTLALMCNSASLACGDWLPSIGELFNHSAWFWMKLMIASSDIMSALPGAYFYIETPTFLGFLFYYFVLIALLCRWFKKHTLISSSILGIIVLGWSWQNYQEYRTTRITVLEAGDGNPIYVDSQGSSNDILVNCGAASSASYAIKPFLISQGVNRLSSVVLTHGDARHVGAFPVVQRYFSPRQLITSSLSFRSTPYRQILSEAQNAGLTLTTIHAGDMMGPWQVLHPGKGEKYSLADDAVLVFRAQIEGITVMLCSDLGPLGQKRLLEYTGSLNADIVVAGIPSKGEPLSETLLNRIQPQAIIISTSAFPASRAARTLLPQRLRTDNIPVYYTDQCGSVTLNLAQGRCIIKTMTGQKLTIPKSL